MIFCCYEQYCQKLHIFPGAQIQEFIQISASQLFSFHGTQKLLIFVSLPWVRNQSTSRSVVHYRDTLCRRTYQWNGQNTGNRKFRHTNCFLKVVAQIYTPSSSVFELLLVRILWMICMIWWCQNSEILLIAVYKIVSYSRVDVHFFLLMSLSINLYWFCSMNSDLGLYHFFQMCFLTDLKAVFAFLYFVFLNL